jgi:hypothetical protein
LAAVAVVVLVTTLGVLVVLFVAVAAVVVALFMVKAVIGEYGPVSRQVMVAQEQRLLVALVARQIKTLT